MGSHWPVIPLVLNEDDTYNETGLQLYISQKHVDALSKIALALTRLAQAVELQIKVQGDQLAPILQRLLEAEAEKKA